MRIFPTRLAAALLVATLPPALPAGAASPSAAAAPAAATVTVQQAWARPSPGASTTGAAYVTLAGGASADTLVGASTPAAASAEVHTTMNDGGVMKMRPVPSLPIPAGGTVTMAPGGFHIMLMGLKQPLKAGQAFPLTLTFDHAAPVTVDVSVRASATPATGHGNH